jgi:hypothetical protein
MCVCEKERGRGEERRGEERRGELIVKVYSKLNPLQVRHGVSLFHRCWSISE